MGSIELKFGKIELLFLIGVFLLFSIATIIGIYHYSYLLGDDTLIIFITLIAIIIASIKAHEDE